MQPDDTNRDLALPSESFVNRAKSRGRMIPAWIRNATARDRVFTHYRMFYAEKRSMTECIAVTGSTPATFYEDLKRARREIQLRYQDDLALIALEQVESRKELIRQARAAMAELNHAPNTPARARAIADLLRTVADNEKAVEELLGVRGALGTAKDRAKEGEASEAHHTNVIIDLGRLMEASNNPATTKGPSAVVIEHVERSFSSNDSIYSPSYDDEEPDYDEDEQAGREDEDF